VRICGYEERMCRYAKVCTGVSAELLIGQFMSWFNKKEISERSM
jgi:hypothetical protein